MSNKDVLQIAEIPYDTGEIHFRYSRYLASDRTKWIKHGLFRAYHKNGQVASEGEYEDGVEVGVWRDYHENGQIAAEGEYKRGKESGRWRYWTSNGDIEREAIYFDGVPSAPA
ncbi:MAG TPA: hypothetical protein VEK79_24035 [Thermoanaerobaculia bacterium]|nr:hypothetical protein [Thermoanaerobaculia bacterium]